MKLYHLVTKGIILTGYPMPHAACLTMRSKFNNPARISLMEVLK